MVDKYDAARREAHRMADLRRLYRVLTEELDAIAQETDPSQPSNPRMPDDWVQDVKPATAPRDST